MTNQEAIEELKYDCEQMGKSVPCDTGWGMAINEAYGMAVAALEKQIPKKLILSPDCDQCDKESTLDCTDECATFRTGNPTLVCPNCKRIGEIDEWKLAFCPECGQAIDWSE